MSRKIVLVDDSTTVHAVVELSVMEEGYELAALDEGAAGAAEIAAAEPDVVLLDVHVPGRNGYELCRQLRSVCPDVPVILLVGTFQPFDAKAAADAGAAAHLKKPFSGRDLMQKLEGILPPMEPAQAAQAAAGGDEEEGESPLAVDTAAAADGASALDRAGAASADDLDEPAPLPALPEAVDPAPLLQPHEAEDDETVFDLESLLGERDDDEESEEEALLEAAAGSDEAPEGESSGLQPEPDPFPWRREAEEEPEATAGVEEDSDAEEPTAVSALEAAMSREMAAAPGLTVDELEPTTPGGGSTLSDDDVERIARKLLEIGGEQVVRTVAWEVVPDLAEVLVQARLREIEESDGGAS